MSKAPIEKATQLLPGQSDDIDLHQVIGALLRRKNWIAGGGALGLVLSGLSLLEAKPIYQGEFQIVLANKSSASSTALLGAELGLSGLLGSQGGGKDSTATELAILKSPSVLRPVFDAVKARKPPEQAQNMRFRSWASSAITAEQVKGTTVVNVKFRDTDKQIVLPITKMISEEYQSYSYRGRKRELKNLIAYLKEQINIIKPKSKASSRLALDYGFTHGLGILDGLPLAGNVAGAGVSEKEGKGKGRGAVVSATGGSVEVARTQAQQKVKALEVQIQEVNRAGAGSVYFASQLSSMTDKSSTFDKLTAVEVRLSELRSRLKNNDPLVAKLERERNTLIKYINQQTIALLNGELDLSRAKLKALNRPKEVVARHRELTQEALRDEATMVTLQNQLKQLELQQARDNNPWELISTPTLLDTPVSPIKRKTLTFGLLIGLVAGTGAALVVDRRSGIVFSTNELQSLLPCPLLKHLPAMAQDTWTDATDLLASGPLAVGTENSAIALIPLGNIPNDQLQAFSAELRRALKGRELIVSTDLRETSHCVTQLVLTAVGVVTRTQLSQLSQKLALQGTPIAGWVLLDPELNLG
ncbi:Wzz/FepE/Etk N-terminal domain-containing protein [Synechococcus sp. MIT S9508]|uniref:GumC family protein n=1 Tax=Synechococcus sp. MIT S9508 TaxID=1801629 RepID=UPI0007BB83E6|nr:Wzz/FepE/Etk N-terminal domain-containing protein [Synechococcus sp. MIT S9508]KZR90603.1 Chain length determinant protein [Synechococcus sp. MIT S9508]